MSTASLNPLDLTGATVVVTGASSGLGRETAVLFSQLGARCVLVGRDEQRLAETAGLLQGSGHRPMPRDLSAVEEIPAWLKAVAAETGPLRGLVHSAGIQMTRPLRMLAVESVREVMRINLTAAAFLAKGFRQRGVSAKGGSLVFVSAGRAFAGEAGASVYAASKGALVSLAKSLAVELAREGIRVNAIAPGHVETEMVEELQRSLTPEQWQAVEARYPLGIGTPRDVANAAAFLISDASRWVTGTTLIVDGGYTAQ